MQSTCSSPMPLKLQITVHLYPTHSPLPQSPAAQDTWQMQHAPSMQVARRNERSGWEMGHSSEVRQGLSNFAPVIKMLIKVAPRHPHLLTSWALRHTFPRQPKRSTREVTRPPHKASSSVPPKHAAWKPRPGSPWIACEQIAPQRRRQGVCV